jgi:hypothetical protein
VSDSAVRTADGATFDRGTLDSSGKVDAVHGRQAPVVEDPAVAWVPVEACTLPTAEQPLRVAEFEALFAGALRGVERREPGWLRLVLDGAADVEGRARELVARESSCCSFFDFRLTPDAGHVLLDVRVPAARTDVLDGLARQAEAARTGAGTVG